MWNLVLGWRLTFAQTGLAPARTDTLYSAHSYFPLSFQANIKQFITPKHLNPLAGGMPAGNSANNAPEGYRTPSTSKTTQTPQNKNPSKQGGASVFVAFTPGSLMEAASVRALQGNFSGILRFFRRKRKHQRRCRLRKKAVRLEYPDQQ